MSTEYNYDDNFLMGLRYLEAFFAEDEETGTLIEEQLGDKNMSMSLLQVLIVSFVRMREKEAIPEQQIIEEIRNEFLQVKSQGD